MKGPGKYDDICTIVREKTQASSVVVIILDGNEGNGFSAQSESPYFEKILPKILRSMADELEDERNKDKLTSL